MNDDDGWIKNKLMFPPYYSKDDFFSSFTSLVDVLINEDGDVTLICGLHTVFGLILICISHYGCSKWAKFFVHMMYRRCFFLVSYMDTYHVKIKWLGVVDDTIWKNVNMANKRKEKKVFCKKIDLFRGYLA